MASLAYQAIVVDCIGIALTSSGTQRLEEIATATGARVRSVE